MAAGDDDGAVGAARPYSHGIQRRRVEVPVLQIGIDIGGTFTDCVLIGDPAGRRQRGVPDGEGAVDQGRSGRRGAGRADRSRRQHGPGLARAARQDGAVRAWHDDRHERRPGAHRGPRRRDHDRRAWRRAGYHARARAGSGAQRGGRVQRPRHVAARPSHRSRARSWRCTSASIPPGTSWWPWTRAGPRRRLRNLLSSTGSTAWPWCSCGRSPTQSTSRS